MVILRWIHLIHYLIHCCCGNENDGVMVQGLRTEKDGDTNFPRPCEYCIAYKLQ